MKEGRSAFADSAWPGCGLPRAWTFMSIFVAHDEAPWRAGFRSARANILPGFVLQLMALALVTAYYNHEGTHTALDRYASWRLEVGPI